MNAAIHAVTSWILARCPSHACDCHSIALLQPVRYHIPRSGATSRIHDPWPVARGPWMRPPSIKLACPLSFIHPSCHRGVDRPREHRLVSPRLVAQWQPRADNWCHCQVAFCWRRYYWPPISGVPHTPDSRSGSDGSPLRQPHKQPSAARSERLAPGTGNNVSADPVASFESVPWTVGDHESISVHHRRSAVYFVPPSPSAVVFASTEVMSPCTTVIAWAIR